MMDRRSAKLLFERLATSGIAQLRGAPILHVGLGPFLDAYEAEYLGSEGIGAGLKLILGANGEGKSHLLFAVQDRALAQGHATAFVEAKSVGLSDSPFVFAQHVMRALTVSETRETDEGLAGVVRAAVARKRIAAEAAGLSPETILAEWSEGLRHKPLSPHGLAQSLADAVRAAITQDDDGLRTAVDGLCFSNVKRMTGQEAETKGRDYLKSIPKIVEALGLRPIVLLLDEAEDAVLAGARVKQRQTSFLTMCRFLHDQFANGEVPALVLLGCTDGLWPDQFYGYRALYTRFEDPNRSRKHPNGQDTCLPPGTVTPKALAKVYIKIWVRETFAGTASDYQALGAALLELALIAYPDIDSSVHRQTADALAAAACGRAEPHVKRDFVKAFCSNLKEQEADGEERALTADEAARAMSTARTEILRYDEDDGA